MILTALFRSGLSADTTGIYVKEPVFNSTVYLETHGPTEGPTIVLVHGAGEQGSHALTASIGVLQEKYHVIHFDLPGFGRSEKTTGLYSPENYARFLKWVIDTYAAGPVYLVGHSLGGAISLYFAGTYPHAIERLILIDAAGILHRATFTKSMMDGYFGGEIKFGDRNLIEKPIASLKNLLGTALDSLDSRVPENLDLLLNLETFRRKALQGDPARIAAMAMINTDFGKVIADVAVPTHIIWGEDDAIAPLRTGQMLACAIDRASLIVLNGRGHSPMLEDPTAFNAVLLQSIADPSFHRYVKISRPAQPASIKPAQGWQNMTNVHISGSYESITIENCRGVNLTHTYAKEITIKDSEVSLVNTWVEGGQTAMNIINSIVYYTGGQISGQTALWMTNSLIDMAGSSLTGEKILIASDAKSTAIFSVSQVKSPQRSGFIHQVVILDQGSSF